MNTEQEYKELMAGLMKAADNDLMVTSSYIKRLLEPFLPKPKPKRVVFSRALFDKDGNCVKGFRGEEDTRIPVILYDDEVRKALKAAGLEIADEWR